MLRGQPRGGGTGRGAPTEVWRGWRRLAVMLASGVVAIAGLGACNGADAAPEPDPTTPVAPEPEPAGGDDESADDQSGGSADEPPGPQDYEHPEPGEDIDDEGQAGAEAAAVYFVELYSYVYATGDFATWDEFTTEDCNFCAGVRERLEAHYDEGGYAVADAPTFESVNAHVQESDAGDFSVDVVFLSPEVTWIGADGDVVEDFAEVRTRIWVLLEHREDSWLVGGVTGEELE